MLLNRAGVAGLCALPGALTFYLGFNGGGFFPGQPALVALFLTLTLVGLHHTGADAVPGPGVAAGVVAGALALFVAWRSPYTLAAT